MNKKAVIIFLIALLITPTVTFVSVASESKNNWPMLGGDSAHTARVDATLVPQIGWNTPTRWQYDLGIKDHESVLWSSPISDGEDIYLAYGRFYKGAGYFNDSGVIKVDMENDEQYFKLDMRSPMDLSNLSTTNHFIPTPSLLIEDEKVSIAYVDSKGSIFITGDRRGSRGDKEHENRPIISSPIIYGGKIYCGTQSGYVLTISTDDFNTDKITHDDMDKISGSVAIKGGILTFGDNNGNIFVYDIDDNYKLLALENVNTEDHNLDLYTPTIASRDGHTFAVYGSTYGYIHVVSLNKGSYGKCTSKKISNTTFHSAPSVFGGHIYIGDIGGTFYKISLEDLEIVDSMSLDYGIRSQPILCNGFIYVTTKDTGSNNGKLYIINSLTFKPRVRKKRIPPEEIYGSTSSPLIVGNYLFIPSSNGKVYRFEGQMAILKVSTDKIDFGKLQTRSKETTRTFTISNDGGGLDILEGKIETNLDWITCEPSVFSLAKGEEIEVQVIVDSSSIPLGGNTTDIIITSNGGSEVIEVNAKIEEALGRILVSPKTIDFGEVIQGQKISDIFTVSLFEEDKQLNNEARYFVEADNDELIFVSRDFFQLDGQHDTLNVMVSIDTVGLDIGTYKSTIYLFRNKRIDRDVKTVNVTIKVTKRPPKPKLIKNSEILPIPDIMSSEDEEIIFSVINDLSDGEREPLTIDSQPTFEPEYEWFSVSADFTDGSHNSVDIKCTVDIASAGFWPREEHEITISGTISGETYVLSLNIYTETVDYCEIAFIIDSEAYTVNGKIFEVIPPPFISDNGNTMVPIRFIADPLEQFYGAIIEWIPDLQTVLFTLGDTTLRLIIGYEEAIIELPDGSIDTAPMNSPAIIVDGRTFLPPRTIAEAFGAEVEWLSSERKAVFTFINPEMQ